MDKPSRNPQANMSERDVKEKDWVAKVLGFLPSWLQDAGRTVIGVVAALVILILIALTSDRLVKVIEPFKEPARLGSAVAVLLGALAITGIVEIMLAAIRSDRNRKEEEQRATFLMDEMRQRLDPTNEKGLLGPVFNSPGGHIPKLIGDARQHVDEAGQMLRKLDRFCEWGTDWQETAMTVLTALQAQWFRDHGLLMKPTDYPKFVQASDDKLFKAANWHAKRIRLCGSMVGFSFLLPSSLAAHACRAGSAFHDLELIGVDTRIEGVEAFWYSVFLTAQTMNLLWACASTRTLVTEKAHHIIIETRYATHDLLAAAMEVTDAAVAVLQALDVTTLQEVIASFPNSGTRPPQPGFRFDRPSRGQAEPGENEGDEYSRYSRALTNVWTSYAMRSETWVLAQFDDGDVLKIFSPRWECDGQSASKLWARTKQDFETESAKIADHSIEALRFHKGKAVLGCKPDQMQPFLDQLLQAIAVKEQSIEQLEKVFREKGEPLSSLRRRSCACPAGLTLVKTA